jgi:hypothetical protein
MEHLIPFKGRLVSGAFDLNLLSRSGRVYVMDNHRAALWCWFQHLKSTEKVNLLHLDRHTDTLYSKIDLQKPHMPDMWTAPLDDYLTKSYKDEFGYSPLINWANYLSLFLECYPQLVETAWFVTHELKDEPRFHDIIKPAFDTIPDRLDFWMDDSKLPWIVNIDIDYFFYKINESYDVLFSDQYFDAVSDVLKRHLATGKISVLTIALSPDFCGGWQKSESVCAQFCNKLGISFELPNT